MIENSSAYKQANIVLLYWSMDDEVPTHDFILSNYENKTILLPCVVGDNLVLRKFFGMQSMKEGEQFSILEPTGEIFSDYEKIDLIDNKIYDKIMLEVRCDNSNAIKLYKKFHTLNLDEIYEMCNKEEDE